MAEVRIDKEQLLQPVFCYHAVEPQSRGGNYWNKHRRCFHIVLIAMTNGETELAEAEDYLILAEPRQPRYAVYQAQMQQKESCLN